MVINPYSFVYKSSFLIISYNSPMTSDSIITRKGLFGQASCRCPPIETVRIVIFGLLGLITPFLPYPIPLAIPFSPTFFDESFPIYFYFTLNLNYFKEKCVESELSITYRRHTL